MQDQEQVDKLLSVADQVPLLTHLLYDEERGLRDYDHARLHPIAEVIDEGRKRLADADESAALSTPRLDGRAGARTSPSSSTPRARPGRPKGVMLVLRQRRRRRREIGCDFDKLREGDEIIAYLPIAWVGDHIFSYAQAIIAGLCVNCPESPDTVVEDRREIGTTYAFAPPRVFENMLTLTMVRMEDASALKRRAVPVLHRPRQQGRRADPQRRAGRRRLGPPAVASSATSWSTGR